MISGKDREFTWIGHIDQGELRKIIPKIITAFNKDSEQEIVLWINNRGGTVTDSFAFFDFIKAKKVNLTTIGFGIVASGAVIILASGRKRMATKNTTFAVHPPYREVSMGVDLSAMDCVEIAKELEEGREQICELLTTACNNGRSSQKKLRLFQKLYEQYNNFDVELAKRLGLIQEII